MIRGFRARRAEKRVRQLIGMAPRHPEWATRDLSDADEHVLIELADQDDLDDMAAAVVAEFVDGGRGEG